MSYVVPVRSKVEISQNFVAFSEYVNFNAGAVLLMVTSVYTKLGMHYKCELMRCHKFSQGCPKIYLDMLPIKYTFLNVCDPIDDTVPCCEDLLAQMLYTYLIQQIIELQTYLFKRNNMCIRKYVLTFSHFKSQN